MWQPLPLVVLLYVSGILLATRLALPLCWLFPSAVGSGVLALCVPKWRSVTLWPLVLLTGWINCVTHTAILSPRDLRILIGENTEYLTLRGELCETPIQRLVERDHQPATRSVARIQVKAFRRKSDWEPACGQVAVSTPGLLNPRFFAGQEVEITGVLRSPKGPAAEGLFDYRTYLWSQNIYYQLAAESTNEWSLVQTRDISFALSFSDRFLRWARTNLAKGLPGEDESLRLLWAMTLGWKTALTEEVSEPFMRNGTLHIFAISGLHIALIAGILVSVLRVTRCPRAVCGCLIVPALWFYTAATGWQSSAIRSTIMMSIIIGGWALQRPSDLINSLAAAGLIILVWEPKQLFQAGFQLSFFVVLSIGLLLPPLEKARQCLLQPDPFLPPELRPRWQRWLDLPLRYVTTSLATSLAAWLGSLPLIAYYFYLVTPVSLLANLLIVPLSSVALMSSLGSLLCGDWLPKFTELFNHSAWFWMKIMIWLSDATAALPGAYFYVRPPSLLQFFIYYLLLGGCLSGWLFAPQRRKWAAFGFGLLMAVFVAQWRVAQQEVRLTILPLGGGALFADFPGRSDDLLIDCGSRAGAEFVIKPFLRSQGIKWLPQVLLTHGDLQRVGGMDYLEEHFSIARILTSSVRFRSPTYRRIVAELENSPEYWLRVDRGDFVHGWKVLHPGARDHFAQADDNAIVLRGEFHGIRVLLLSDLGKVGQRTLLEREEDLRADIVVAGLPAQGEPVSDWLIQIIQPQVLVLATADSPISARASPKLRERLGHQGIPVIYTSEAGAVTLVLRPESWTLKAMNQMIHSGNPIGGKPQLSIPSTK
jgi:competence protein ComEC